MEPQRAGDPQFDYLLGIAALDAGDPQRAVFALERVLAQQPDNALARAEIARAFYAMGEREAARQEFEAVRKYAIPEEAKATVDRFLSAIAAAEGLTLTQDHWDVIEYLRDAYFNHNGEQPNNRAILKAMQDKWAGRKVDNKTLFDLYPGNPSKQAGKIAGLPESLRKGGY